MAWQMSGQYFESCNCDVLCPCITTGARGMPTQGHCDAVLAFRVDRGAMDGVELDGLTAVVALRTDGPMAAGVGRRKIFLDAAASPRQREALEAIFSGAAGGAPAAMAQLAPTFLGTVFAPIRVSIDGESRELVIEGFGEQAVQGIAGAGATMQITNAPHPANTTLALARATRGRFKDADFDFDNAGKNGHFAPFSWSG